ncbi:MAG: hypothetical protein ABIV47_16110 [Roseiflexaceae bacterium]
MEEAAEPGHVAEEEQATAANIDKRGRLDEEIFSYRESKDKVFIFWYKKQVMILKAQQARKFLDKIADLDGKQAQLVMAKITGNFKHGNER